LERAKVVPIQKLNSRNPMEVLTQIKQKNGVKVSSSKSKKIDPKLDFSKTVANINIDTLEDAKVTEKKGGASIWLANNFPLKFTVLILSIMNNSLALPSCN